MTDKIDGPVPVDLRADLVALPLALAVSRSLHVLGVALPALAATPPAPAPPIEGAVINFQLPLNGLDEPTLRAGHQLWLVQAGFHSLAKGLRFTMERALIFCRILAELNDPIRADEFHARTRQMELDAEGMRSDRLARELDRLLREPMQIGDHLKSLTQVRNCLEHRDGIVGAADIGDDDQLHLTLPYLRIFAEIDGVEMDLEPGFVAPREVQALMRLTVRRRTYALGDHIAFTPGEFSEIAQGCWLLANDVVGKLPQRPRE